MISNNNQIDSNIVLPHLSYKIMGILFKVHNELGPSLLEKYYQRGIGEELLAIIVNFRGNKLRYKRVVNPAFKNIDLSFEDLHIRDYLMNI